MKNREKKSTEKAISPSGPTSFSPADALQNDLVQPPQSLRKLAEEIQQKRIPLALEDLEAMPIEKTLHILQELQVHQIELEIQNEELRRTQVELAATRARYFDLYDLAPVGYLTIGPQGVILESNLTAATILGSPRNELVGLPFFQFILNEYQDTYHLFQREILEAGKPLSCELQMAKNDATTFWAQLYATKAYHFTGMSEFQLVLCDISEARQAEEALHQNTAALAGVRATAEYEKSLLASVMEALPIGVAITDTMGGTIQTNLAFERLWGGSRPPTRLVEDYNAYMAWWDETGKSVTPEEWASTIAIQKGETTVGKILRIQRFDGSEALVINSASPVYDGEGNIIGSAVAVQDITELKRAEQALLVNKEDFARAQEVGNIGSWRLDVQRDVLFWSDENHRIFGVPKGTPLSYESFLSIVHPEDRAYVDTQWQKGLRGEPYDIEHRLVVDGRIKWVREKAYLEFDKNGVLAGGFGITQDITERKLTEELIKQRNDELRQQNGDLEIFNKAAVGRELRMIELKKEINELCRQAGQPPRYPLDYEEYKT